MDIWQKWDQSSQPQRHILWGYNVGGRSRKQCLDGYPPKEWHDHSRSNMRGPCLKAASCISPPHLVIQKDRKGKVRDTSGFHMIDRHPEIEDPFLKKYPCNLNIFFISSRSSDFWVSKMKKSLIFFSLHVLDFEQSSASEQHSAS